MNVHFHFIRVILRGAHTFHFERRGCLRYSQRAGSFFVSYATLLPPPPPPPPPPTKSPFLNKLQHFVCLCAIVVIAKRLFYHTERNVLMHALCIHTISPLSETRQWEKKKTIYRTARTTRFLDHQDRKSSLPWNTDAELTERTYCLLPFLFYNFYYSYILKCIMYPLKTFNRFFILFLPEFVVVYSRKVDTFRLISVVSFHYLFE